MIKTLGKAIGILFGGILAGVLLLTAVYLLPLTENSIHAAQSAQILDTEGWYPSLPLIKAFDGSTQVLNSAGTLDNFTDRIMIYMASAAERPGHPLYQAMNMSGYRYYWHGYVVLLRPLLLIWNYADIRVINQLLQLLLVMGLACLLYRRKGLRWAALLLTIYLLLMPMALFVSLQYSWVFYIGILGSWLVVYRERFFQQREHFYLLLLALGMLTSYFDLLTYPLFTWGIPTLWWIVMNREKEEKKRMSAVVCGGLFWILGYGGMWAGKWVVGQLVLQNDIVGAAVDRMQYRAGMLEGTSGADVSRWVSVVKRWEDYCNVQTLLLLAGWSVWFAARFFRRKAEMRPGKAASLSLLFVSPAAWYLLLHNHSYDHGFTFRTLVISFAAVLAALLTALEGEETLEGEGAWGGERQRALPGKWKLFSRAYLKWELPFVILLAALGLTLLDEDSHARHNGASSSEQIVLSGGQVLEQEFRPQYAHIRYLDLGIGAAGEENGSFMLELVKDGKVLDQRELAAAEIGEGGFYDVAVDWRLHKNALYTLRLSVLEGKNTEYHVWLTTNGERPLEECAIAVLDRQEMEGQLIMSLGYRGLPDKAKLMLEFFSWAGLLFLGYFCCMQGMEAALCRRARAGR